VATPAHCEFDGLALRRAGADVIRNLIYLFLLALFGFAVAGPWGTAPAYAQTAQVIDDYGAYRFYTLRRHNDMQGVEAVFDDYRRNWLKRSYSTVMLGAGVDRTNADTPNCAWSKRLTLYRATRADCGSGHVFRSSLSGFVAKEGNTTDERGAIGYIGYEHLVSDRLFLGFGATLGTASIDQRSAGETLDVTTNDTGLHLIGGYRFRGPSMMAWNISFIFSDEELTRNGTITGSASTDTLAITGVWDRNYDLRPDRRLSLGIDYTLLNYSGGSFVDSSGAP